MALIVLCGKNAEQYVGRNNFIGVLVHDLQHLAYGRGSQPHRQADFVKFADFIRMLFSVNVHQQYQSVKLDNSGGLGP